MIWPMIRGRRDHFFKKRFSKLDFLKAVSVIIVANSEKMKMKKSHLSMTFAFPLPSPFSPTDFFKNCSPYSVFRKFHSLPFKKRTGTWRGEENYVYLFKILIFDSFLCSCWSILLFFFNASNAVVDHV